MPANITKSNGGHWSPDGQRCIYIAESDVLFLQPPINVAGPATLWSIAGDVQEITLLAAFRANIRRCPSCNQKSAFGTFPVRQVALGADISLKLAVGCIAAVCTYPFFLLLSHFAHLLSMMYFHILILEFAMEGLNVAKLCAPKSSTVQTI